MPTHPTYPGVYLEEIPSGVRTITGVSTSVAAFIGYFQRGPIDEAVEIFSFGDFERRFGGLDARSEASYAIQQFFLNGGTHAFVVRVVSDPAQAAEVQISHTVPASGPVLTIQAIDPGSWGNHIRLKVDYDVLEPDTFNLFVTQYGPDDTTVLRQEVFRHLSMLETATNAVSRVINDENAGSAIIRVKDTSGGNRPAANGTMSGAHEHPNQITIADTGEDNTSPGLSVSIGHQTAELEVGAGDYTLTDLARHLQSSIRSAKPGLPAFAGVQVNVAGNCLHVLAGPGKPEDIVSFGNLGTTTVADTLLLSTSMAIPNVQEYALGVEEISAAPFELPVWQATDSYEAGDYIQSSGSVYCCKVNHEAGSFSAESSNWEEQDVKPWAEGTAYTENELIITSDQIYRCTNDHTAGTAFQEADGWEALPDWESGATYSANHWIATNNEGYRCVASHESGTFAAEADKWEERSTIPASLFTAQSSATSGADGELPGYDAIIGKEEQKTGLYALEDIDLFNLLCIPRAAMISDATGDLPPEEAGLIWSKALDYCEKRRAFLLMDTPIGYNKLQAIKEWVGGLAGLRHKNAALYYPRLYIPDPLDEYRLRSVGPSGTIAGLYARIDAQRGVWKAPAGTEAVLRNVPKLTDVLSDPENGVLNPLGVNCIRSFPVHGTISWGARTLVGADQMASDWKYVPVRRLALFLEESLYRGTQWVVFEPNDEPLWGQIRLNVGAFMNNLFRQGAFQGASPREAYLVKCDSETTTQNDINAGRVNIWVGFAPLKPAEFVIIKIQQLAGQIQV